MTPDHEERAWWVFQLPASTCYVPASSEEEARTALVAFVCKELREEAKTWPMVSTRWCSRERLHR